MDDVGKLLRRTKEFIRTGKKAGRNGIQGYRKPFLPTCYQERNLEIDCQTLRHVRRTPTAQDSPLFLGAILDLAKISGCV